MIRRWHSLTLVIGVLSLLLSSIALRAGAFAAPSTAWAQETTPTTYLDPRLGFTIQLPTGWTANTYHFAHAPAENAAVQFHDPIDPQARIQVSVMRDPAMPNAFAQKGHTTAHVGAYPAIVADTAVSVQSPQPCVVRIFLAQTDYVIGQLCSEQIKATAPRFLAALTSYQPAAVGLASSAVITPNTYIAPESCSTVAASENPRPNDSNWGRQLANSTDSRWGQFPLPGAFVCSNWVSSTSSDWSGYHFQCVELANRFDYEQWGLASFDVNAAQYYDYYQNGTYYQGRVRTLFPSSAYQLSDDASQGTSAFKPNPGDLIIFQDVNSSTQGWTSGLNGSAGHVAIVTATTSTSVSVFQQNFDWLGGQDTYYYDTLPMSQVSNGWHITPQHVGSQRITRGWIHFTANSGAASGVTTDDVYAVGADGGLYLYHWRRSGSSWVITNLGHPTGVTFAGTPSASTVTQNGNLVQDVYLVGNDGSLHEYWLQNGTWSNGTLTPPTGVKFVNSPSSFSFVTSNPTTAHHSVFVLGDNGHLYNYAWAQSAAWTLTDVSTTVGMTVGLADSPSAETFVQSGVQTQDIYAIGSDGVLYEFWHDSAWHFAALGKSVPLPSGVTAINSPSSFTFSYPGESTIRHSAFVIGSDGHLYDYAWAQSATWTVTDVTTASNLTGVNLIHSPSGDYFVQSGSGMQDVYALGNDNHMHEFWYSGGSWHTADVSAQASATSVTIIGSPSAFTNYFDTAPTTVRHSTFVVTNDGHLREFLWVQSSGNPWQLLDHGTPGTTTLADSPDAHSYSS